MAAQLFLLAQAVIVSFLFAAAFQWKGPVAVRIGMVAVGSALMLGLLVFRWRVAQILSRAQASLPSRDNVPEEAALPNRDAASLPHGVVPEVASRGLGVGGATFAIVYIWVVMAFTFIVAMVWPT